MSRVEVIGNATLYLGDCREILPQVKANHVVTDPPYAAATHKGALTNKGPGCGTRLVTFASLTDEAFADVCDECLSAVSGWVVMTCDFRHASLRYQHPSFVRLGAWVKPNPMPQISGDRPGQGFETVLISHAGVDRKAWNRGGGSGVWTYPVATGAEVPTQKPIKLAKAFVADFSLPGEVILDPFCGSGTTGVASIELGRSFVGIEIDRRHYDIACRRIEAAQRQGDMFMGSVA